MPIFNSSMHVAYLFGMYCIALQSTNIIGSSYTGTTQMTHWLTTCTKALKDHEGTFHVHQQEPLLFTWHSTKGPSSLITERIREAQSFLVDTYTDMELKFAQQYPEAISQEMFLKALLPLVKESEPLDWDKARKLLASSFHAFFNQTDFAQYVGQDDISIFVHAYHASTRKLLGSIQFCIAPDYDYGTVKVGMFSVQKNTEIAQLLMSSLFKLVPETTRLFLHTRITNTEALTLYGAWGFSAFEGPLPYWSDREYLVSKHTVLQTTAQSLT